MKYITKFFIAVITLCVICNYAFADEVVTVCDINGCHQVLVTDDNVVIRIGW